MEIKDFKDMKVSEKIKLLNEYNLFRRELQVKSDTVSEVNLLKEIVKLSKDIYGAESNISLSMLNELGGAAKYIGEYEIATSSLIEAKTIISEKFGENSIPFATCLLNLTEVYRFMQKYDELEDMYLKVLEIYEQNNMQNDYAYAGVCNNLGLYYQNTNKYEKAILLHEKSIEILKKLDDHRLELGTTYNNLIIPYKMIGNNEKSEECIKKCFEIYDEEIGQNHSMYSAALNNLAIIYYQHEEYEKSLEYFEKSIEICKNSFGENSDNYKNLKNNIDVVKDMLK